MTESTVPLAGQARRPRWWLSALARRPLLILLIVVPGVATALIWTLWQPAEWVKLLLGLFVVGPIGQTVKDFRERQLRALEQADEAAERTGRRRPWSAPAPEPHPATFTWSSATGRRLTRQAAVFATVTALGTAMTVMALVEQPVRTPGDVAFVVLLGLLLVVLPGGTGVLGVRGPLRRIRQVLAADPRPVRVDVVGTDPVTTSWVLRPVGSETLLTVRLLGSRHLLVAGDELLARGPLDPPAANWRRATPVLFALTGPFGTLWARHSPT